MKLNEVASKITPKTKVLINGIVDYCHIATKIDGDELKKANEYTDYPSKDPYYKITIQVLESDLKKNIEFDPANQSELTLAAFVASKIYASKKEEKKGKMFYSITSKGSEIRVFKKGDDGKLHKVNLNGNELGAGCKVQLEVNFYRSNNGFVGVGLNSVVILGDIVTYDSNNTVKGYETAADVIDLAPRTPSIVNDMAAAEEDNTPVTADVKEDKTAVEVDAEPVGSVAAPDNSTFDALLAEFNKQ